jgi:hypothetical protein
MSLMAIRIFCAVLLLCTGCTSGSSSSDRLQPQPAGLRPEEKRKVETAVRVAPAGVHVANDFEIDDTPNYKGLIFTANRAADDLVVSEHYKNFWPPTREQIAQAEARISEFLDSSTNNYAAQIRKNLKTFRRQYVGYNGDVGSFSQGEKRILCNFVPPARIGEGPFEHLQQFERVYDKGPAFWSIHHRVDNDRCYKLRVNTGF